MDNLRILGTEPSSVILSQTVVLKFEKWYPKVPKTSWIQKGCVNKPTQLQFQLIMNTDNVDALKTLRINRNRP